MTSDLSLQLSLERELSYYRLTNEEPWESTILHTSQLKSKLTLNYFFLGDLMLSLGAGNASEREFIFMDNDRDSLSRFFPVKADLNYVMVSFAIRLGGSSD